MRVARATRVGYVFGRQARRRASRPSPRTLEVVEAEQPIGLIDDHADRVEADRVRRGPIAGLLVQPRRGETAYPRALTTAQPRQRLLLRRQAPASVRATSLDLDKGQRLAVEGDQVDLTVTRADVACDDCEAESLQMGGCEALTETAERSARVPLAVTCRGVAWRLVGGAEVHAATLDRRLGPEHGVCVITVART
jgi:hypothetical protein